jgi:uncharacterized membrane protein
MVVGTLALLRVGYPPGVAVVLAVLMVAGSVAEVPLLGHVGRPGRTRIGLNVGGAIVPLGIALERSSSLPEPGRVPLAASIATVGLLSFGLARTVPGRGIVLAWPLTGMLGAALGLVFAPSPGCSAAFAFVAGLLGPFLGAELPNLPALARLGADRAAIGGGGVFDGLVWSAMLAALLGVGGGPLLA